MILTMIYWLYCEIRDKNKPMTADDCAYEEAEEAYEYWSYDDYFERIKFKIGSDSNE